MFLFLLIFWNAFTSVNRQNDDDTNYRGVRVKKNLLLCLILKVWQVEPGPLRSPERFSACQHDCAMHFAVMSAAVHGPELLELLAFTVNNSWCLIIWRYCAPKSDSNRLMTTFNVVLVCCLLLSNMNICQTQEAIIYRVGSFRPTTSLSMKETLLTLSYFWWKQFDTRTEVFDIITNINLVPAHHLF